MLNKLLLITILSICGFTVKAQSLIGKWKAETSYGNQVIQFDSNGKCTWIVANDTMRINYTYNPKGKPWPELNLCGFKTSNPNQKCLYAIVFFEKQNRFRFDSAPGPIKTPNTGRYRPNLFDKYHQFIFTKIENQ